MDHKRTSSATSAIRLPSDARGSDDVVLSLVRPDTPITIAQAAREFGVTMRALRFYESKRLIAPLRAGSVRLYRQEDRERIAAILMGRRLGFTLAEIRDRIAARGDGNHTLDLTREECVAQINLLERQKRNIEVAIAELRRIYTSFYRTLAERAGAGA
jgi:DNA-binding transcriptional MerR regulator